MLKGSHFVIIFLLLTWEMLHGRIMECNFYLNRQVIDNLNYYYYLYFN